MGIKVALETMLGADAGVYALVASPAKPARIYPYNHAPQADRNYPGGPYFPRLVYLLTGATRTYADDGPTGQVKSRILLGCWALRPVDADALADAVRLAVGGPETVAADAQHAKLSGFRGVMAGVTVDGIFMDDASDEFLAPVHADDVGCVRNNLDLVIWHREAT